jgi:uncharacterized membrane protein YeaQ/YmgE (transglycosylase-associated protein family)
MMDYIGLILVGLVVGALARFFLPGRQSMGWAMNLFKQGDFLSWIASVIAAILLLVVYGMAKNKPVDGNSTN